jgi:hypothetical protein
MSADEFAKQGERRRSKGLHSRPAISTQVLEELHRHGVLIPLFRVGLTEGEPSRQIDLSQSLTAKAVFSFACRHSLLLFELLTLHVQLPQGESASSCPPGDKHPGWGIPQAGERCHGAPKMSMPMRKPASATAEASSRTCQTLSPVSLSSRFTAERYWMCAVQTGECRERPS